MDRVLVEYYGYEEDNNGKRRYFIRSRDRDIVAVYIYVGGYIGIRNGIRCGSGWTYNYVLKSVDMDNRCGWLYVILVETDEVGKYLIANIIEDDRHKLLALLGYNE